MNSMNTAQMELGFGAKPAAMLAMPPRRASRLARATWWFEQMRLTVDRALEWRPAPPSRPQQAWLQLTPDGPRL